jgi:hypothetical protein
MSDEMMVQLIKEAIAIIELEHEVLVTSYTNPKTGEPDDEDAAEEISRYEDWLKRAKTVIA